MCKLNAILILKCPENDFSPKFPEIIFSAGSVNCKSSFVLLHLENQGTVAEQLNQLT